MRASLVFVLFMTACVSSTDVPPASGFEAALKALCGKAFEGRIVTTDTQDDDWRAQRVVMHVRTCAPGAFDVALHVGENRSRTWVFRRTGERWDLRHDHRHEDGAPDALTMYGGVSATSPEALVQDFPADDATKALFDRQNIPVSKANVWTVEATPAAHLFVYQLKRPNRFLRVEFDTSKPVAPPPTPWGWAR